MSSEVLWQFQAWLCVYKLFLQMLHFMNCDSPRVVLVSLDGKKSLRDERLHKSGSLRTRDIQIEYFLGGKKGNKILPHLNEFKSIFFFPPKRMREGQPLHCLGRFCKVFLICVGFLFWALVHICVLVFKKPLTSRRFLNTHPRQSTGFDATWRHRELKG